MTNNTTFRRPIGRRTILQGGAGLALATAFTGVAPRAHAAGGKVIIGAFADGGLTPFKEKIIPLAKAEGGFDIQFLEDEYGVTLEKWFADAKNKAGQYDLYLLSNYGHPSELLYLCQCSLFQHPEKEEHRECPFFPQT